MRICILASEVTKKEILAKTSSPAVVIIWAKDLEALVSEKADVYMDLKYVNVQEREDMLRALAPSPLFINSVATMHPTFIRINAWTGFLLRPVIEIAAGNPAQQEATKTVMQTLGWGYSLVPDQPGMITPRVIAMIINEAYFALEENVSTKAEIDTAMKLGTNYPYGPFEWAEKVGLNNVLELLETMSRSDPRYIPSEALRQEVK